MPKSCKKRKMRKLKQSESHSDKHSIEIDPTGRKQSKSSKQRVSDFFRRITNRSNASDSKTCSNSNNREKHVVRDRGDPAVVAFLDDIHVTTEGNRNTRGEKQTEKDIYDAYQNINKQRSQETVSVPLPLSSFAQGHSLLTSALIEMLNNEPTLQEVPIYRVKTRSSGDKRETYDKISTLSDNGVKYNVGETVFTGGFNLKVLNIIGESSEATVYKVNTDATRNFAKRSETTPVTSILEILGVESQAPTDSTRYAAKISKDPSSTNNILRESEFLSTLRHDNIVSLAGKVPGGYLMEALPESLDTHIKRNFDTTTRKVPLRDPITVGILKAVSYLHQKEIGHLDINPENVLITADGVPKLANFGLALRIRDEDGHAQSLQGIRGSIPFLSPEILAGGRVNIMTAVDAWAVGVVMYAIFTGGKLPFAGTNPKEVYQQQVQGATWVPHRVRSMMGCDESFSNYFFAIFLLLNFLPERRPSMDIILREISPLT